MAPAPKEKTSTLSFRVDEDVSAMIRELADDAGLSLTDFLTTFVRAAYKVRFPKRAAKYETAAERFERRVLEMGAADTAPKKPKR